MPYRGNDPLEAWEYWFDAPPSETVQKTLKNYSKSHPDATILAAIEKAFDKRISEDTRRLQYVNGYLQRTVLATADPERAELEHKVSTVQLAWEKKKLGSLVVVPKDIHQSILAAGSRCN